LTVALPDADPIEPKSMPMFRAQAQHLMAQIERRRQATLASTAE
jgi:hypothetical protein